MATTAPSRWSRHRSTAAAERGDEGRGGAFHHPVTQCAHDRVVRRQALAPDAGSDHGRIDQDWSTCRERAVSGVERIRSPRQLGEAFGHRARVDQARDQRLHLAWQALDRGFAADCLERSPIDRLRVAQVVAASGHRILYVTAAGVFEQAAHDRLATTRRVIANARMAMMMMIVAIVARVRADALDVMVMAALRRADRRLVPDDPFAVPAQHAVHADIAGGNALDPLDERVQDERVVVQIAGLDELDPGCRAATASVWA